LSFDFTAKKPVKNIFNIDEEVSRGDAERAEEERMEIDDITGMIINTAHVKKQQTP
jgi:hypothetical protein